MAIFLRACKIGYPDALSSQQVANRHYRFRDRDNSTPDQPPPNDVPIPLAPDLVGDIALPIEMARTVAGRGLDAARQRAMVELAAVEAKPATEIAFSIEAAGFSCWEIEVYGGQLERRLVWVEPAA